MGTACGICEDRKHRWWHCRCYERYNYFGSFRCNCFPTVDLDLIRFSCFDGEVTMFSVLRQRQSESYRRVTRQEPGRKEHWSVPPSCCNLFCMHMLRVHRLLLTDWLTEPLQYNTFLPLGALLSDTQSWETWYFAHVEITNFSVKSIQRCVVEHWYFVFVPSCIIRDL